MADLRFLLAAFALSALISQAVRAVALRLGVVDRPRADRWHRQPIPRLGGIAIYLGFTVPLVWLVRTGHAAHLLPVLVGGTAIFLVGFVDDLVRLENRPKLILLIVCSAIPVLLGVRFEMLPPLVGTGLAMVWILGATNAFNWLDNMDGVAGGIGALAAVSMAAFGLLSGGEELGRVGLLAGRGETVAPALLLGGASLGFLLHNFPPARLFMGDAGSGFLGFTLATIAVMGNYRDVSNILLTILVPGLILAVPIFDTLLVTVQRILHRRSIFQGGRDHPAHRLVAMGLPERKAVLLLYGLSTLAGIVALFATRLGFVTGVITSLTMGLGFVALGIVLSEVHVYAQEPAPAASGATFNGEREAVPGGGAKLSLNGENDPVRSGQSFPNGATLLPQVFLNKRWVLVMALDLLLAGMAYVAAHLLRWDGMLPPSVADSLERTLPLVVAAKMVGLYLAGVYRGSWRYAGALDYARIAQGATVGSLLGVAALFLWTRLAGISRGALVLDWLLVIMLVGTSRLSLSVLREYLFAQAEGGQRVLIFGAGHSGVLLLRELRENGLRGYRPVGFIDDDPAKCGTIVHGLRVLGGRADLARLVREHQVDEVLLAISSGSPQLADEVRVICTGIGTRLRRLEFTLQ
jgi:UDP-GlcNAc:undecaprenyl-phosphate GlcNAc-1-phosphate transferase